MARAPEGRTTFEKFVCSARYRRKDDGDSVRAKESKWEKSDRGRERRSVQKSTLSIEYSGHMSTQSPAIRNEVHMLTSLVRLSHGVEERPTTWKTQKVASL